MANQISRLLTNQYSTDEEINNNEYREWLLTFSPDFFVFLFAT